MIIDHILDKIIEIFKDEEGLSEVLQYRKVNGVLPDVGKSISVGCKDIKLATYSNNMDEVNAEILIYACLQEMDPEIGQREAWKLADIIGYCLNENQTLSGLLSASEINQIEYIQADPSDIVLWHAAVVHLQVQYYKGKKRQRPVNPVETIKNEVEKE